MRPHTFVGLLLLAVAVAAPGGPAGERQADRLVRRVKQLGDKKFAKREAASKELDAIGEPALGALKAAASSDADPEIRSRAAKIVRAVTGRLRAAVMKKELARLQGTWSLVSYKTDGRQIKGEDPSHVFSFQGDRWSMHVGGQLFQGGTVTSIEVKAKLNAIDLLITEGSNVGATAVSIYAVEGNSLKYLNCGEPRATDFTTRPGDGRHFLTFRRARPAAARPPEARFESAAFSTDRAGSCVHRKPEGKMRPHAFASLLLLAVAGAQPGDPAGEGQTDRVARLIKQLGHNEFAKREAASKELDAIGEPALDALRKATSEGDPEVRQRARRVLAAVTRRARAAVTRKELEKLQGAWSRVSFEKDGRQIGGEDKSHLFIVKGDKWWTHSGGQLFNAGTVASIEVKRKFNAIDFLITEGNGIGVTIVAIYAVEGDSLKYLSSGESRATDFTTKPGDGRNYAIFRRARPGAARSPELRFESAAFSTDLLVPESKAAVHRVTLTCRPADGEAGTLTFDPTAPKFDAFGDPVPGGQPSLVVTLACTLKLVKAEKDRQLFELRGPKVVSRLSLVVYKGTMPEGDGRLLVHGRGGEVRYAIDLARPELRVKPCHPGCFPAGTPVLVPGGQTAIERLREGDLVTVVDAVGKPTPAKVAGVFVTRNRVLEVRTEGGPLVTTATQPVALEGGGFRAAGELKVGDRIWRWVDGKRRAAAVTAVTSADREVEVFNLILGEPTGFVAGGFLVRSKPPAVVQRP